MAGGRKQIVRDSYAAFAAGDRGFFEQHLSESFSFLAPPDPELEVAPGQTAFDRMLDFAEAALR